MPSYTDPVQILMTSPQRYARDVATDTPLTIQFSTDLDTSSLTKGVSIEDERGQTIPGEGSYSTKTRTYTFTPDPGWPAGETVRVLLRGIYRGDEQTTGIRSTVGTSLVKDYYLTFTVAGLTSPRVPVLIQPPAQSLLLSYEEITFAWQAVEDATHYELQVSLHPSFEPLYEAGEDARHLTDTSWHPQHAFAVGLYYWRVRAWVDTTPGQWSQTGQFSVEAQQMPPHTIGREIPQDILEMDAPIEVLATFPEDGFASVGDNIRCILVHIDRPLPEEEITDALFTGFSAPSDDRSGVQQEFHEELVGTVRQVVEPDGTALLIWDLEPIEQSSDDPW